MFLRQKNIQPTSQTQKNRKSCQMFRKQIRNQVIQKKLAQMRKRMFVYEWDGEKEPSYVNKDDLFQGFALKYQEQLLQKSEEQNKQNLETIFKTLKILDKFKKADFKTFSTSEVKKFSKQLNAIIHLVINIQLWIVQDEHNQNSQEQQVPGFEMQLQLEKGGGKIVSSQSLDVLRPLKWTGNYQASRMQLLKEIVVLVLFDRLGYFLSFLQGKLTQRDRERIASQFLTPYFLKWLFFHQGNMRHFYMQTRQQLKSTLQDNDQMLFQEQICSEYFKTLLAISELLDLSELGQILFNSMGEVQIFLNQGQEVGFNVDGLQDFYITTSPFEYLVGDQGLGYKVLKRIAQIMASKIQIKQKRLFDWRVQMLVLTQLTNEQLEGISEEEITLHKSIRLLEALQKRLRDNSQGCPGVIFNNNNNPNEFNLTVGSETLHVLIDQAKQMQSKNQLCPKSKQKCRAVSLKLGRWLGLMCKETKNWVLLVLNFQDIQFVRCETIRTGCLDLTIVNKRCFYYITIHLNLSFSQNEVLRMRELHLVKVTVNISKISIAVKFPCSLKVHLRSDQQFVSSSGTYPLRQCQCDVKQTLQLEVEATFDTQKKHYNQSQISLAATIASTNSNISAGVAVFNPFVHNQAQEIQTIETLQKCSDREAKIYFTQSWSYIKKIKDLQNQNIRSSKALTVNKGLMKNISFNRNSSKEEHFRSNSKDMDLKYLNDSSMMNQSRVKVYNNLPSRYGGRQPNQRTKANITYNNYNNESSQRRENILKSQVQMLNLQVQKLKQKCRNSQRKQRELNLKIKDLKENVDNKKKKWTQSQQTRTAIQQQLNDKQKQLNDLKTANKKLQEQIDDTRITTNTTEKKLQMKEKGFQVQLRICSQKISQLEKQVNKKTYEYNLMLQKMEVMQRNHLISNKEKERKYGEEKTGLVRRVERCSQQIEKLKVGIDQRDVRLSDLSSAHKALSVQEASKATRLDKLESQYQLRQAELNHEKNQRISLQNQLQLLSSAESDKNTFKKRYNQTFSELTRTKQKLDRLTSSSNQLTNKFNQLQQKYKDLALVNRQLNIQYAQATTGLQNLKKQHTTLTNQFNSLSAKHLNMTQKLNDNNSKLDAQKQDFQNMQAHYEDKLNYLIKTKQFIGSQAQDWKQRHQKQQSLIRDLQAKNKAINDQILLRHGECLKLQQTNKKALEIIQELTLKAQQLQVEVLGWQKKQKSLLESLKLKGNDVYNLQRKLSEQEQELFIMQQKVRSMIKQAYEKQHNHEKDIGQKDKTLNQRTNQIQELKQYVANIEEGLQKTTFDLNNKKKDLILAEDRIKQYVQAMQKNQIRISQLQTQIQMYSVKMMSIQEDLQNSLRQCRQIEENHRSLDGRWVQYRKTTCKALEQFITQLGKDQPSTQIQLLEFADTSLATVQMAAIKSRNQSIIKYRTTISGLQEQIQLYQKQIQKTKSLTLAKQAELDSQVTGLKTRQSQLHDQWMQVKQEMNKRVSRLQEQRQQFTSEAQKLRSTVSNLEDITSQLNEQKVNLEVQIQLRDQQICLLADQVLELKSLEIKAKSTNESVFKEFKQQTQQQMDKIKKTLTQTSEKLLQTQNQKQDKQSRIAGLEKSLEEISCESSKQSNKRKELETKVTHLEKQKEELRSSLNGKQRNIQALNTKLDALGEKALNLESKQVILEAERKKTYELLTETQITKEKFEKALQLQKQTTETLRAQFSQLEYKNSCSNQDLNNKIKEQKDSIAKLQSQIELKSYVVEQLVKQKAENETQIKQLQKDIQSRKTSLLQADKEIESLKGRIMNMQESQSGACIELQSLREQNSNNLEKITELENHISQIQPRSEQLVVRLQQIEKMKGKTTQLQDQLHKTSLQLQTTQNQVKNINNKLSNKEQQYRKKIYTLQTQIAQKQHQSKDLHTKTSSQWQRQKATLIKQLQEQDKSLRNQQHESKFRTDQLQGQIESVNQDCLELSNLLSQKEEEVVELQNQLGESQKKISDLNGQLKSCLEAWDKEKAAYLPSRKQMTDLQSEMGKFQQYAAELDAKTKQLLEVSRKKGTEESKFGITEILRDLSSSLSKSKVKVLSQIQTEHEKQTVTTEYRQLQEKIDTVMRSQKIIYR